MAFCCCKRGYSMKMSSYKYTYFDFRARGEFCRYIFLAAGRDFIDDRVQSSEWPSVKMSTPYGQIPVLAFNGTRLAQSNSIARYLGREFGLVGKDSLQQAQVDMYIELVEDLMTETFKAVFEKDPTQKKELMKTFNEVELPKYLRMFESAYEKNGGKFIVGNSLTIADLAVYNGFETPLLSNPSMMDRYPLLKGQRDLVEAIPNIRKYINSRKQTDF